MLRLSLPHLDEAAISEAAQVLRGGQLVHGAQGQGFEQELRSWLGCRHALVVSSGTAALHLSLLALGIGAGDAVLVPDFSFPATANVVLLAGARPVLVDVDPQSYCVTPTAIAAAIDAWRGPERLRAVMPVHEFGRPVDMPAVLSIAHRHRLAVVEDAACAIGARVSDRHVGTFGSVGCFSMHPRKTLTTGEGGILVTEDDAVYQRLSRLRNHGQERTSEGTVFVEAGFNYRLTDFQSALGRSQLPRLGDWIKSRRALATAYRESLKTLAERGALALPEDHAGHSWQTFMVVLGQGVDRQAVIARLADLGVECNLGAQCLSAQPALAGFAAAPSPVAMRLYRQGLALPFCEQYGQREVELVTHHLEAALSEALR